MRFWDSSAIVPLLIAEERSSEMENVAREDSGIVLWWGSPTECVSAIRRQERASTIERDAATAALRALDMLLASASEILPNAKLRARAHRLLAVHRLRAADALQLAAALGWTDGDAAGAAFVCLDERLADAASREGFTLVPR